MKRHKNIFNKIWDYQNLQTAHKNARRGKGWYREVKEIDANPEQFLIALQGMIRDKTYRTSAYERFTKIEGKKEREIFKLLYYPDRICQWAILQVIEPHLIKTFTADTYSAIPGRGIHQALYKLRRVFRNYPEDTRYCLKIDVKKYYPNIDRAIMKEKFAKMFKDKDFLWLIGEIIDSSPEPNGIPIGNYVSQYCGNLYLSEFDHWVKETAKVRFYFRYMDDMLFMGRDKEYLRDLLGRVQSFLSERLNLKVKENWQIFPVSKRGVDFVGYRVFPGFSLLRKSICKKLKFRVCNIHQKIDAGNPMNQNDWLSIQSYGGWLGHCDSHRLVEKYLTPLEPFMNEFYEANIKSKGGNAHGIC